MSFADPDLEEAFYNRSVLGLDDPRCPAESTNPLLAQLRTGAWLDAQTFNPLHEHVRGIIAEGLTLLVGPPKVGKSQATLAIILAIASGGVALGVIPTGPPRPVLLLALEDGDRRLQDRCRRQLDGEPIPPLFHYVTRLVRPGTIVETINAWVEAHHDDEPVVVLDTLGKVMPPALNGESAYQRDYRIASALKRVADDHPGTAVVVLHHDRKAGSDDFVDAVSGTHGLAGAADTVLVLARRRHEHDATLQVTGRDIPEGEYALRVADGIHWQLAGADLTEASRRAVELRASAGLSDRSLDVLAYVNAHPEGVRPQAVEAALDLPDARQYLGRLEKQGRIAKPRRGTYTPRTTVTVSQTATAEPLALSHRDTCDTGLGEVEHDE